MKRWIKVKKIESQGGTDLFLNPKYVTDVDQDNDNPEHSWVNMTSDVVDNGDPNYCVDCPAEILAGALALHGVLDLADPHTRKEWMEKPGPEIENAVSVTIDPPPEKGSTVKVVHTPEIVDPVEVTQVEPEVVPEPTVESPFEDELPPIPDDDDMPPWAEDDFDAKDDSAVHTPEPVEPDVVRTEGQETVVTQAPTLDTVTQEVPANVEESVVVTSDPEPIPVPVADLPDWATRDWGIPEDWETNAAAMRDFQLPHPFPPAIKISISGRLQNGLCRMYESGLGMSWADVLQLDRKTMKQVKGLGNKALDEVSDLLAGFGVPWEG